VSKVAIIATSVKIRVSDGERYVENTTLRGSVRAAFYCSMTAEASTHLVSVFAVFLAWPGRHNRHSNDKVGDSVYIFDKPMVYCVLSGTIPISAMWVRGLSRGCVALSSHVGRENDVG
jgi:hypothetical protein